MTRLMTILSIMGWSTPPFASLLTHLIRMWRWWQGISKAEQRKWSARGWWLLLHFYAYGVFIQKQVVAELSSGDCLLLLVVALANGFCFITLQLSSPGYVVASEIDLEFGPDNLDRQPTEGCIDQSNDHEQHGPDQVLEQEPSSPQQQQQQRLISKASTENGSSSPQSNPQRNRFCEVCHVYQPLRTKHCKHCDLCVRQYDHHCDCAGTCIGERNRRKFLLFLVTQTVEALHGLGLMGTAFRLFPTLDEWMSFNWPVVVGWFALVFVVLFTLPLLCYQMYLISTNQTSWEHARRRHITYLNTLPTHNFRSPFDRGFFMNWWVFCTAGDANKWVHAHTASPSHAHQDESAIL